MSMFLITFFQFVCPVHVTKSYIAIELGKWIIDKVKCIVRIKKET